MTDRHGIYTRMLLGIIVALVAWTAGAGSVLAEPDACVLTITCPPNKTIECNQSTEPWNTGTASFTANVDCGPVTLTHSDAVTPGACPAARTITRTWTATPSSGTPVSCVQTITVVDTQGPSFPAGCNRNVTYQCVAEVPPPGLGGIGPIDNCDPSVTLTSARTSNGGAGCVGNPLIITDTYTATDDCGNSSQCVRTYTVIDNTPPTISCPPALTISGPIPPCNPSDATAADNCGSVTITCTDGPITGGPCSGFFTRTYTATDNCGNTASCDQLITFTDNEPPTIVCPADFAVECVEDVPPCDPDDATVTDGCGPVTVICDQGPLVGGPCGGTITRTYTATDAAGNTASCTQTVTVDDTTPPVFTSCPPTLTVQCLSEVPPCAPTDVTVTDNCDAPVTVTCTDGALSGDACDGAIVQTFVATDACGNVAVCERLIVISDETPPVISGCPAALTVACIGDIPPCNTALISATDNCGGAVTITCSDAPLQGEPCGGSVLRTYLASDACGNTASCMQMIIVDDNTPPTIVCPPSTTVECGSDIPPCSPADVTVSDNCGGPVTVTCSESPLTGDPCSGSVIRTYTATDECGNSVSCTQTINVVDNTPPTITCLPNITVQRILDLPPCNINDVTVTDNCSADITVTCSRRGLGGIGCTNMPIPVTYTFKATDACGNEAQCVRIVTVLRPDCPFSLVAGDGGGVIDALSGQSLTVPIRVDEVASEISSFELAVRYDREAATVLGVERGAALTGWEHFSYRLETALDGAGVIRLTGIADLNNGSSHPPVTAFMPLGAIANVRLAISADPAYANRAITLTPCLDGCSDNTVVSRDGEMTFVMAESNIETCEPTLSGAVLTGVRFEGVQLNVRRPQRMIGDLNLNGSAYEVGDVVLLTNYLVHGMAALADEATLREAQFSASDVNDDGIRMTVADLRYLLRVVTGDAQPLVSGAKLSPFAAEGRAQFSVEHGLLTVATDASVDLGGALFVFRTRGLSLGAILPNDAASGLTFRSHATDGEVRVLAAPTEGLGTIAAGQRTLFTAPVSGSGSIDLVEVQLSDAQGALLSTASHKAVVPADYALEQNYPNPFNAGTVIAFALKEASDWSLTIYNVMGQVTRNYTGHSEAGRIMVAWDGADQNGATVASGVYFYRLETAQWSATKKMILVK